MRVGAEPGTPLRSWGPDSRKAVAAVMFAREDGNMRTHFLGWDIRTTTTTAASLDDGLDVASEEVL